jgi:hypothetical protein
MQTGVDRIKRSIMKNDYEYGGLKVTDLECLDRSLKLRQFIRANNSNHVISGIQQLVTETENGSTNSIRQEYFRISEDEPVCKSAQETINIMTDYNRCTYDSLRIEEYESNKIMIEEVASINLNTYLKRKGKSLSLCILRPLTKAGIETLGELIQAYEHEQDEKINMAMKIIINSFPKSLINIVKCFNDEINDEIDGLKYLQILSPPMRMSIDVVTTKELQTLLKIALKKVEVLNVNTKLGIEDYDPNNIITFRKYCKNSKLRNIYFRLIHKDFFTYSRMKKYKMTESDSCPRCNNIETINHLLWECAHARNIWDIFNHFMTKWGKNEEKVQSYENIYKIGNTPGTAIIKIRIIQELIQMERPKNWTTKSLEFLIEKLIQTDEYNAKQTHSEVKFLSKWSFLNEWTKTRNLEL